MQKSHSPFQIKTRLCRLYNNITTGNMPYFLLSVNKGRILTLWRKINSWWVSTQVLYLLQSFLTGRRMIVGVNGHPSRKFSLDKDVPQESLLSVGLYNIYANTLYKKVAHSSGVDFVGIFVDNIFALPNRQKLAKAVSCRHSNRYLQIFS